MSDPLSQAGHRSPVRLEAAVSDPMPKWIERCRLRVSARFSTPW